MFKATLEELKKRFDAVHKKHMDAWDLANPMPERPTAETIEKELLAGMFSVNKKRLIELMAPKRWWGDTDPMNWMSEIQLFEVVTPKCVTVWKFSEKLRQTNRSKFEEALTAAKTEYLDRCLFDHENGFLLLKDFKNFVPNL